MKNNIKTKGLYYLESSKENMSLHPENIYKLVTKEDSSHFHKILGGLCLLNYVYRYGFYICYGHMNFVYPIDIYFLFLHALLSVSSLIFHISNVRNPQKPMIYPEYRMHSILFSLRSISCCLVHYYSVGYKYNIIICGSTFILADIITKYYNPTGKNGKTMRNMPFDKSISIENQNIITIMHSYSQIGATIFMFGNIDSAFSPMFAIQLAAFLMTLVRKGIIDSYLWHLIYSLSLWINFLLFTSVTPGWFILFQIIFNIHYNIIFHYKINKYVAWIIHFFIITYYKELGYQDKIDFYIQEKYKTEWYYFIRFFIIASLTILFYKYRSLYIKFFRLNLRL